MRSATLIVSDDEFLGSEALDEIRRQAAEHGYAREEVGAADATALLYALGTPSMFDAGRLIVVLAAQDLSAEAVEIVSRWAADPHPSVSLALVAEAGAKADRLAKALGKAVHPVRATAPAPWDTPKWVAERIRKRGRKVSPEAAQMIVEALGTDLRELASAVDQLLDETEGAIDVAKIGARFHGIESKIYEFVDAVLDRDQPQALKRLRSLQEHGEKPTGIVAALWRQLRIVAIVKDGARRPPEVIAREIGVRPGPVKRAFRQARNFEADDIRRAYAALAEADVALKSESQDELILDLLVSGITARR